VSSAFAFVAAIASLVIEREISFTPDAGGIMRFGISRKISMGAGWKQGIAMMSKPPYVGLPARH
jgi:hypothetical protein